MDQNKLNKAIELHRVNNFDSAKLLYEEIISDDDSHFLPFFFLGALELDLQNYQGAIKQLKLSLDKNPNHSHTYLNLGTAYYELRDYKNCKKYYEQGTKINQVNNELLQNLATIYKDTGDIDKATSLYKKIYNNNPDDLKAAFWLHNLKVLKLDKGLKKKIKLILKNKNSSYTNKLFGNMLLSKYANKASLYKDELKFILNFHDVVYEYNKIRFETRKTFIFEDLKNIKQYFDKSITINGNEKIRESINPIFIISHPRTGSTLVEKLITYNQDNLRPGEEASVCSIIGDEFLRDKNFNSRIDEISEKIINKYQSVGLISKKEKISFTDKSTDSVYYLGWIKSIFPNAKFINCTRDPKASIVSILRNNLGSQSWAHKISDITKYIDDFYNLIDYWQKEHQIEIYNFKYEDLINNFEHESKRLMDFCSLKWSKDIINFNTSSKFFTRTASNLQVRQPMYKSIDREYESLAALFENDLKKYKWSNYSF
tara:strand:- start:429 stop:1883 length:1455 start_codon:yes stop_codon:yes gene_type:complete